MAKVPVTGGDAERRPPIGEAASGLLDRVPRQPAAFAVALALILFIVNVIVQPAFVGGSQIAPTLGTLAPLAIAGMASTPAFLSGGGGIDLSIAPLMGFINILLVTKLFGTS